MRKITIAEVKYLSFKLAKESMSFNEPIPDFSTRFPEVLESCLITPFQTFQKKSMYRGQIKKAAVLFYLMVKNHPFQNGNKRIATTTLLVFLYMNNKWLKVDSRELYNFAVWVAESPASLKDEVVLAVEKFVKKNIVVMKK
ncbi:MAG: type II toxin-antitoxin system death-on-curing family toxin [Patescibacteria group bacterium]